MPPERPLDMGFARWGLALVLVIVMAWVGAGVWSVLPWQADRQWVSESVAEPSISPAEGGSAMAALVALAVRGRASKSGYARAQFGQVWADVNRNGCDTRNDVLRRDLAAYQLKSGSRGCLVLSGTLLDPYTATTITFARGQSTSSEVQIDHVVALSDAWQKGAQQWSTPRRTTYANDLLNLLAVDGPTNQRKGDGDAATWLPPNKPYRCSYAARQVAVKAKYGLWVTSAERDALARILATCPAQPLPTAEMPQTARPTSMPIP